MVDRDRQTDGGVRARRRRRLEIGLQAFTLAIGALYLVAFTVALRTGYLSWIGVLVGVLLTVPGVISPILGLAGRRRLSAVLTAVSIGLPILVALVLEVSLLRAKSDDGHRWRAYRFDEELAAIEAKRAVPDEENAANRYAAVFAATGAEEEPGVLFRGNFLREEIGEHPWKGEDHPQAAAWLDLHADLIAELTVVGQMENCRWPVQADTYDPYTVSYKKLRLCMQMLTAAGNRDLGEGRVTEALTKYFCVVRMGEHLRQQPSGVDFIVSFSYERESLAMVRHMLVQSDLSNDDVACIIGRLPSVEDPWPEAWERLLEFEKLQYMNLLGRLYEVDDKGRIRFARCFVISTRDEQERKTAPPLPRVYWLATMPRDPGGVPAIVGRYFAHIDHRVRSLDPARADANERFAHVSLTDLAKMASNIYRWWAEMAFFNEYEYLRYRQRCIPCITTRRGTWLVLGLRRYREEHGMWPVTLGEIAEYVPGEAFSDPTNEDAFVYAREGESFRLYSKGANRVDEGGRHGYVRALDKTEDDINVWPPFVSEPELGEEEYTEETLRMLEQAYGREYVQKYLRGDPNADR